VFDEADRLRELCEVNPEYVLNLCKGKIMAEIFYEPSTRTKSSFHAAMIKLGGGVIHCNAADSSVQKGETIEDFAKCMEQYCDITVLRSTEVDYLQKAASVMKKPLINAGNGADEHPTQALLDVYTIRKELGTVNGLCIAIVGDLKHGRTAHSLAKLLALYDVKLMYVSPKSLKMPKEVVDHITLKSPSITQSEHRNIDDIIQVADVIYMTRVQRERFDSASHYESVRDTYTITPAVLAKGKESVGAVSLPIVMHPLPRNNEISVEIDSDPRAAYFRQMENGMYVRMALINLMLHFLKKTF
jgi:aspartate carbamoyltransferase